MFHVRLNLIANTRFNTSKNLIYNIYSAAPNEIINMTNKNAFNLSLLCQWNMASLNLVFFAPASSSTFSTLRYQGLGTSHKPYTVSNSFHKLFVSTSLGFFKNIDLLIGWPGKNADFISRKLIDKTNRKFSLFSYNT